MSADRGIGVVRLSQTRRASSVDWTLQCLAWRSANENPYFRWHYKTNPWVEEERHHSRACLSRP